MILEDLIDVDVLRRFNDELDPLLEAPPAAREYLNPLLEGFFGTNTRVTSTTVPAKSRVPTEEVLVNPALLGICDSILGPSCSSYQLNLAHVLDRGPGTDQQMMHRDELVWVHLPKPHPQVQVATVIALVDFTAENGATRVVPGSHRATATGCWMPRRSKRRRCRPRCVPVLRSCISARHCTAAARTRPSTSGAAACMSATSSAGCAPRRTTTSHCGRR